MPTCSETYGEGWTGNYPNCTYSPTDPSGLDVASLGYGGPEGILAGSTWETGSEKFFDPYSTEAEERFTKAAGIDVDQLGTAWDLSEKQLGETWGLKIGELGWGAGLGLGEARRTGIGAKRKSGMAFSGTAEGMQKTAERDVMGKYRIGLAAGKTAYEQALEVGELKLSQATSDIYQDLEEDVYDERRDWKRGQRSTLDALLGSGIWPKDYDPNANQNDFVEDPNCPGCKGSCMKTSTGFRCIENPGENCPEGTNCNQYNPPSCCRNE